jgi:hypothetical protein
MVDYYPLISNAVGALDKKSKENRHALYERARWMLADQLRRIDPPLSEANLEHERLALDNAISKVEAGALLDDLKQLDDHFATVETSSARCEAKLQRERRIAFWLFLIIFALLIGDQLYTPSRLSNWHDWLRLGGISFFSTLTILSYFSMRNNWSAEQEDRAYIIFAPMIILVTLVLLFLIL